MPKRLLSIALVGQTGRRGVAGLTAAFMLLCNLYCACGGTLPGSSTACHDAAQSASAPCSAHCDEHAPDSRGPSEPEEPKGAPPGHTGCAHCNPLVSLSETSASKAALHSLEWDTAFLPLVTSLSGPYFFGPSASPSGNLLPSVPAATLLSLHCALNT